MKRYRLKFLLVVTCILAAAVGRAQDIHFSQFFEAPLLRNPSLAGIYTGDVRVQGVYRDQWNSVTNGYRTGSLNAEYKMPLRKNDDFITAGVQVLYDKAGDVGLTSTHFLPAVNYHKSLSNEKTMYLSLGFMGGLIRKSVDFSKITTDNQYGGGGFDPSLPVGEYFSSPNFMTWDASVGLSFNTTFGANQWNSLFLGAAYHHLNRPKNSFYRDASIELNPKYVFSAGVKFNIDGFSYITFQADQSIQGSFSETIGGALYSYKLGTLIEEHPLYTIHAGAFLRWGDALIPVLKLERRPLSIAISYDVNISPLKTASQGRGGFEISLSYVGFLDRENSSLEKVLCPRF
jgi:type IX secretion system PorP/SprF family membrane protein